MANWNKLNTNIFSIIKSFCIFEKILSIQNVCNDWTNATIFLYEINKLHFNNVHLIKL